MNEFELNQNFVENIIVMTLNEKLTLIIGTLGLLVGYITLRKSFTKKGSYDLMMEQFATARSLSLKVHDHMQKIIDNGYGDMMYIPDLNMTFVEGLQMNQERYQMNLSDQLFNSMPRRLPKEKIEFYSKGFESQIQALNEIEIRLNVLRRQLNII